MTERLYEHLPQDAVDLLGALPNRVATRILETLKKRIPPAETFGYGPLLWFLVVDTLDIILGSRPVPVPRQLIRTIETSNRIVSFVLDKKIHFGSGMLVGRSHVLTAAHLFFHDRRLDTDRLKRTTVEGRTTYFANIVKEGPRWETALYDGGSPSSIIDPPVVGDVTNRDIQTFDFAIIKLRDAAGEHIVGDHQRGWIDIPTAATATLLSTQLMLRVFQFLDRNDLLASSGYVREVTANGTRVLHTASTADSASGAAILDDEFKLVALHLGGAASGEFPKSNRGLPIRRVAEIIDAARPASGGTTVRSELK